MWFLCYEAGYDGFWLHRLLDARGVLNYVIDPASLQVDRRARRNKTDGVDVAQLLRSLMAYLRGEPKVWSIVRVPSVAEEDNRRLHRERGRLLNERNQHNSRIKGLLAVQGIYDFEPMHTVNRYSVLNDCAPLMVGSCHRDLGLRSCANCSAWSLSWQ